MAGFETTAMGAEQRRVGRRQVLMGAGAGVLGAVGAAAVPHQTLAASGETEGARLVGAWSVTVTDPDPKTGGTFPSLIAFTPGGVVVSADNANPPGTTATPGIGAWRGEGRRFTFTTLTLVTSSQGGGTITSHGFVTLSAAGDTLSGTGTYVIHDEAGKLLGQGTVTATGRRITA